MELLETILSSFVNLAMLLFEYIGVAIITFAGIQGIVNYVRREPNTRLILAKGLAMGLEFKLGSEILRTVIVRNLEEIYIVAGIIVLRAVLTILIHWEIKNEENEEMSAKNRQEKKAESAAGPAETASDRGNVPVAAGVPGTAGVKVQESANVADAQAGAKEKESANAADAQTGAKEQESVNAANAQTSVTGQESVNTADAQMDVKEQEDANTAGAQIDVKVRESAKDQVRANTADAQTDVKEQESANAAGSQTDVEGQEDANI